MKRKKVITLAIVAVVVAGGIFYFFQSRSQVDAVTYKTAAAEKGTLISTISGSGNIVVAESADVNPSITGTVANLDLKAGDTVTAGQTLFTLTNDDLDLEVSQAYTALLQAEQKLTQSKDALENATEDYETLKNDASTAQAKLAYEQAKQELAQAEYQLEQDEAQLEQFEEENEDDADAHSDAEIAVQEQKIVVDKATITSKEHSVAEAKTRLDETSAGTTDEIAAAKTKVDDAELSVTIAENSVTSAQKDYDSKKESAAERTVTAPIDGTISALNTENGDETGSSSAGATGASTGSAIMTIQDLSSLKAVIDINEVDIASVKVDQKVSMTFDAISDLTLTGTVEEVDTLGTSTQGVVTYSATIGFDALDERVRPEMSVNATITIDVKQDALIVSSSAVKTSGDASYVEVLENGTPVQKTVEIGSSNDTQTEILSGIDEGTEVITQTITQTDDDDSSDSSSVQDSGMSSFRMLESGSVGGGMPTGGPGGF